MSEEDKTIQFMTNDKEILKLSEEGFLFKGELIADAGEAYKIFIEVMGIMKDALESKIYITSVLTMEPYETYNDGIYKVFDSREKAEQCIKDHPDEFELNEGDEYSVIMSNYIDVLDVE